MSKILLIEDDKSISDMVTEYLTNDGFIIVQAFDGKEAIELFKKDSYDLILLDLMIPNIDGMNVMKEIRRLSTAPILITSAKDSEADKALGLSFGADDYITKPFSLLELSARIKANIRRTTRYNQPQTDTLSAKASSKDNALTYKSLYINPQTHQASLDGKPLSLTNKEFDILKLLARHPERVYTKEQIYTIIWNEPYFGEDNVINVHINRLRSKLEALSSDSYINTLWGIGYKMEAD